MSLLKHILILFKLTCFGTFSVAFYYIKTRLQGITQLCRVRWMGCLRLSKVGRPVSLLHIYDGLVWNLYKKIHILN